MTGTALTEANEFIKIYKLQVVDIPTNKAWSGRTTTTRSTRPRTASGRRCWTRSRPATRRASRSWSARSRSRSSEKLSDQLRRNGVNHVVLNAKPEHAEREGETIAEAGRIGAVTIATNMAGRGVDIMLGGNAEHLTRVELRKLGVEPDDESWDETYEDIFPRVEEQVATDHERVKELGGLFILGTERHESRRIDNQLRGRAGRQGDPGESRFYLSAEDDLVRLFAGDRIYRILDRLGPVDEDGREQPIEAKMLSRTIENAQKKVEQQNFLIRKRVLEYDDVMNQQREVVYKYRREILEGRDMSEPAKEELRGVFERIVQEYTPGRLHRGLGRRRACSRRSSRSTTRASAPRTSTPRRSTATSSPAGCTTTRSSAYARREERARRGADARARARGAAADHRRALARAPVRHGLPARGHPPARVCPARPAGRVQERGLHPLPRSDELDLGGLRRATSSTSRSRSSPAQAAAMSRRSSTVGGARRHVYGRRPGAAVGALRRRRAGGSGHDGARRGRSLRRCPRSRRVTSRIATGSAATTPAGAARARSSRSATGPRVADHVQGEQVPERVVKLRDQLKLLADYL